MVYLTRQHPPFRPAPISLLLLFVLCAAIAGGIVALPGRAPLRPAMSDLAGTTSLGAMLTPDPQTGGLRLLAQEVAGDLRVITDRPLTVAGDLRAGGALELRAPRLSITASVAAASVELRTSGLLDLAAGQTIRARAGVNGGEIRLVGDALVLAGNLDASGASGGTIDLGGRQIIQAASASAVGNSGAGGSIVIQATAGYVGTTAAVLDGSGAREGGYLRLDAGAGRLFSSAPMRASGRIGGSLLLLGQDIALVGANLDASGVTAGGQALVGRTPLPLSPSRGGVEARASASPSQVMISPSTQIRADAIDSGPGGRILVWSDGQTVADGILSARGGVRGGGGGDVEVSGRVSLTGNAVVRVDAPLGPAGKILFDPKNLTISSTAGFPQFDLTNPTPTAGDLFGYIAIGGFAVEGMVIPLSTGNVLVLDPGDDAVALNAGAVYLFEGLTGALLSTLTGSSAEDRLGSLDASGTSGTLSLGNGNVVVRSPLWNNGTATDAGAVTWVGGTTGVSGTISASNSLVGSTSGDNIGSGLTQLSGGNYVVLSPTWDDSGASPTPLVNAGAVTWASRAAGISGPISASNSLVGTHANDNVGSDITQLSNGNYVVLSPNWDSNANVDVGAATWGGGASGVTGAVSASNSLVGTTASDQVGLDKAVALTNGNYVVLSSLWNNAGAATWCSGVGTTVGAVSASNSLVGSRANDKVGASAITLSNGNYVVLSPKWDSATATDAGAVTWGNGAGGTVGPISASNSLVGSSPNDDAGNNGAVALQNGSYVVTSPLWDSGAANVGAITWGSGTSGVAGAISASNSLVGGSTDDTVGVVVIALSNGSYVVSSPSWDNSAIVDVGAVTWGNGVGGTVGPISASNSLVGSEVADLDSSAVTALPSNGNYVVSSPFWDNGAIADAGAVTWGSGAGGTVGPISASNSLVGTQLDDQAGFDGVFTLANGNYVVASSGWDNGAISNAGAVTWGSGAGGMVGPISASNSLVGTQLDDQAGIDGVFALSNGNYVVLSSLWDSATSVDVGAATWGNGASGVKGTISASNSLVGEHESDSVGVNGVDSVVELSNSNYVVLTPTWANASVVNAGAATWASGASGVAGLITASNSLVGSQTDDQVGSSVSLLGGGSYLVTSSAWNSGTTSNAGAVTFSSGATGISGAVSTQNSVVGRLANSAAEAVAGRTADGSFYVHFASHDRVAVGLLDPQILLTYARGQTSDAGLYTDSLTNTLSGGAAVTLQANNDITFGSVITVNNPSGVGGAIIAQAGRSLLISAGITTDGAPLTLIANDQLASGVIDSQRDTGPATITVNAAINAETADVTVDLRDGAGKTNFARGGVTLGQVTGNLRIVSGTLTPGGATVGTTTVVGSLSLGGGLNVNIDSASPGQADRIEVTGPVSVGGALLISGGSTYLPKKSDLIVLISNDGSDAVIGTFSGLPEGSGYIVGGVMMSLTYKGGDGNDVVLRADYSATYLPLIRR